MTEFSEQQSQNAAGALRGRGYGVVVGTLMGFGWAYYAAGAVAGIARIVAILVATGLAAVLVVAGLAMVRRARSMGGATSLASGARRSGNGRVWLWFWANFVAEIILMNLAVALLAAPHLHVFWVPAISVVVGLHFFPMAVFFRARSYWWVGAAMIAVAAIAAFAVAGDPGHSGPWLHGEGLANACILWAALAFAAVAALRPGSRARG